MIPVPVIAPMASLPQRWREEAGGSFAGDSTCAMTGATREKV